MFVVCVYVRYVHDVHGVYMWEYICGMCVCMICVYVQASLHVCACLHIHMYACMYVCMCLYLCMYAGIFEHACTCMMM